MYWKCLLGACGLRYMDGDGQTYFHEAIFSQTLILMPVDSIGKWKLGTAHVEHSTHSNSQEDSFRG